MTYYAHVNGFSGHFETLDALKAWATDLSRRPSLNGHTLKIWKATWLAKDGSGASYCAIPSRELVIGA
jgi:hypothetical protein